MTDGLIDKIKSRGYWRINYLPLEEVPALSVSACRAVVSKNTVELRGWDFPHIPMNDATGGITPMDGFCEAWDEWGFHKEMWRMYSTGQFLCYMALREDWFDDDDRRRFLSGEIPPMSVLCINGSAIYQITEFFEFLSRLVKDGLYKYADTSHDKYNHRY